MRWWAIGNEEAGSIFTEGSGGGGFVEFGNGGGRGGGGGPGIFDASADCKNGKGGGGGGTIEDTGPPWGGAVGGTGWGGKWSCVEGIDKSDVLGGIEHGITGGLEGLSQWREGAPWFCDWVGEFDFVIVANLEILVSKMGDGGGICGGWGIANAPKDLFKNGGVEWPGRGGGGGTGTWCFTVELGSTKVGDPSRFKSEEGNGGGKGTFETGELSTSEDVQAEVAREKAK